MNTKKHIRTTLKHARAMLTPAQRAAFSINIATQIAASALFQRAEAMALYLSMSTEVDTAPLLVHALKANKKIYVPVVTNACLSFAPYSPDCPTAMNRFGIPEPMTDARIALEALDMVCVPLLGFTAAGHRLGFGGGYYDRTFAHTRPPCLLGLAFDCQQRPSLPLEPWDIVLDAVVTETQWITPPQET